MLQHEKELLDAMRGAEDGDFIMYAVMIEDLTVEGWIERVGRLRGLLPQPPPMALLFVGTGTDEEGRKAGLWARELVDEHAECLEWLIDEADYSDMFGDTAWYPLGLRGIVALADWSRNGKITREGKAIVDAMTGSTAGTA